ncbi:MAG: hypothetical protein Q8873_05710, partial [Bacillota bacterium]|nr:hypothetical protein [Bacillota bacterium]
SGSSIQIPSTATIFSVPDNRYDYQSYSVYTGCSSLKSYSSQNAEIYQEQTSSGSTLNNCIVLYNESLTSNPSISSSLCIVQTIEQDYNSDNELTYKLTVYEPTSSTNGTTKTYTLENTSYLKATNTGEDVGVGDIIQFGTTLDGKYIKNLYHILDISDREVSGFNNKFDRYGNAYTGSEIPYFWYRYGSITSMDASNGSIILDTDEDQDIEILNSTLLSSGKPIQFIRNDISGKPEVTYNFSNLLKDVARDGDMLFIYSQTANETIKVVYLISKYDLDLLYPPDTSDPTYSDVTFHVTPANATVTLGNTTVTAQNGVAVFTNVLSGKYSYTVSAEDYVSQTSTLSIRKNVPTYNLNPITLTKQIGTVKFTVSPTTATVVLNGVSKTGTGSAIIFSGIEAGNYDYTVKLAGYYDYTGSVYIKGDTTTNVTVPTLTRITSNITFNVPSGATVVFNGESQTAQSGSVVFENVPSGAYSYTVSKEGYQSETARYTVTQYDDTITVALSPLFDVAVLVTAHSGSLPENITVMFNNKQYTLTDGVATIAGNPEGEYSYSVISNGYVTVSGTVRVDEGEDNAINAVLYQYITTTVNVTPQNALLDISGTVYTPDSEGNILLTNILEETSYTVSAAGYTSASGTFTSADNGTIVNITLDATVGDGGLDG